MPCWAPLFTTGCSGSTAPSGCSTSTTCPARSTGELAREPTPRASPNCRPRSWCRRGPRARPIDVEVPFDMVIGGTVVRGRIDAVFADDDGGVTVVDWKTGDPPDTEEAKRHAAIQLAVYRLAWAALRGVPAESVRAAFHYVRRADRRPRVAARRRRTGRAARAARGLGGRGRSCSAWVIIGICSGSRAIAPIRIGQRLVLPQPDHVHVGREHRDEQRDRGERAEPAGARRQQQRRRWPPRPHRRRRCRTAG